MGILGLEYFLQRLVYKVYKGLLACAFLQTVCLHLISGHTEKDWLGVWPDITIPVYTQLAPTTSFKPHKIPPTRARIDPIMSAFTEANRKAFELLHPFPSPPATC